ncbi:7-deoxyloganetic acid glucosyltransferase [Actinidia chinensis var. chinensis]|uniref:Glycosyltransferase n=1 Tax=Actinidia chinensis var. chinensis TaxID=1590841 RepID=A0A2R6PM56_ACTCC|nr:7-deoxyloganetic acid glucosyltransferase [Actinidia chinensis var. chinensis]
MDHQAPPPPHVLIFPLPFQGPVNCMLKLAELLSAAGLHVTFLVTHHIRHRLLRHSPIQTHFSRYPNFQLVSISDGLPEDHPRLGDQCMELFDALESVTKPLYRQMLTSGGTQKPVNCIIADGILGFAIDIAKEIGMPIISFRTISPCFIWVVFCLPKLIESGEIPFRDNDLDSMITSVPGMENFLRKRDLPSFCRSGDVTDPFIRLFSTESQLSPRADGLILNTFEDLEGPLLSHIRTLCPNLYAIGPLHGHLKSRLAVASPPSSGSFRQEDRTCLAWLDQQPPKSVLYVSFGSLATITKDQLMEFWCGLVNSGKRFLWVIRSDCLGSGGDSERQIPAELQEGTKERGYIVDWAPQVEVLAHSSVGGFLTHSGWNSTLESLFEGVPMICWPSFVDQQVNSRFVGEVWGLGLDMKDTCDRVIVEKMVRDLMEERRDEFERSANRMADLARRSVTEGGLSFQDLDRLIQDIRSMSLPASH